MAEPLPPRQRRAKGLNRTRQVGRAIPSLAALTAAVILFTAGTPAQGQTCSSTDTAVTAVNPTDADALAGDCTALLGVKDTLRGTGTLNWANTLSMASWDGVALASNKNRVTELFFPNVGLNGTIPDLSALTGLEKLTLTTGLTGSIVATHLPTSLEELYLQANKFTGSIPDLSGLTNLTLLSAAGSGLTGSLDGTHFPASLQYLRLGSNELTGSIPDLSALTNLLHLHLEDNEFTGSAPDLSALTNLESVQLQHNSLTGSLDGTHFPASLTSLLLSNNELTGSIPDFSGLTSLETLHLHHNGLTGSIGAADFPASLTRLVLRDNGLTGSIPNLSALTSLEWLLLGDNNLDGSIPDLSALTSLEYLYLHRNSLTGSIVAASFPSSLTRLILGGNGLTGGIPSGLDALTSLELLALCGNDLTASATLPAALETRRSDGSLTVFGCLGIVDAEGPEGTTLSFDVTWSTWPVRGDNSWTLDYETENGTATSADYTATGSVTVPAIGSSETEATAKLGVALKADNLIEDDETFTVTLVPSGRAVLQLRVTAEGTIHDAAPPPPAPDPSPDPLPPGEPPTGGTVGGATVTLDFGQSLDTSSVPDASDFTVTSTSPSSASASSAPNEPASVAAAQTVNHTVTAVQIQGASVLLTVSPRIPAGASVSVSYTKGAKPLRTEAGTVIDSFGLTVLGDPPACPSRLTPYWHGTGGFAVRPADGESAVVRIECAGRSHTSREHAGEDGLIVRAVSKPMCTADDGRPIEGEMTFEGIDGDGWYWVKGDRNVAVAPLVCESQLNSRLKPPVPGGVTARPSGSRLFDLDILGRLHGTLMVHDESGFMGIIPHVVDLEGDGEHVAPYWKGGGGIVGRPLDGSRATLRLACGDADAETHVLDAGEDGLIVELLTGCFDGDGEALRGHLEVDGLADGAWYWLNIDGAAAAAPLMRRGADVDLTTPVLPDGVDVEEGPRGTLFSRGPLMGVVPRLERADN